LFDICCYCRLLGMWRGKIKINTCEHYELHTHFKTSATVMLLVAYKNNN